MTKKTLGRRMAEKRRSCGMTQEALAEPEKRKPLSRLVLRLIDGGVAGQLLQVDTRDGACMELWVD